VPITISLKGVGHKLLFAVLVLAPSAFFLRAAARPWLADRIASAQTLPALQLAARYEPRNAERYYALGRFEALTGGPEAAAGAVSNLHAAVKLNPHRGRYWLELARALRLQDDFIGEGTALRQAIQHDPTNVLLAEDAAAFFLARDETADAIREYRLFIEHDAKKAPAVSNALWNQTHDPAWLFDKPNHGLAEESRP
jgi:cytochrome c-type biogenesis protein CcmH/NrfG